jgi:succinate-semialdehyde dehydrogenase / glutarate-semialdehyde dehydrogenase
VPIATVDPTSGRTLRTFDEDDEAAVEQRLDRAASAARAFRRTSFAQRAEWMHETADILDDAEPVVAAMLTTEMGKTLASARQEVAKCAAACRYFADHAQEFLADEPADAKAVGASRAYATYRPLGAVLAVMPWNFPLWQVVRFAAPALMAGNVALLKHASNVPQTARFLEHLFSRGGFPEGVFQTLLVGSDRVAGIIADERVAAVTLTGSGPAGAAVAAAAGAAVKKSVLELGGSDPFIVMPSADVTRAAGVAAAARCLNNGQSCIAAKRFIVHRDVLPAFEAYFVADMGRRVVGDPREPATDIGPLATERQREDLDGLVRDALAKGATVLCGGVVPDGRGWFYPPTVLTRITPSMRIHTEEAFGPVATLYPVDDVDEAIGLANATSFGLGANAWTADAGERRRFVEELEAGMVFLDGNVTSYPELPFGGVKASGYGRELGSHGIREFCNLTTVWIGDG